MILSSINFCIFGSLLHEQRAFNPYSIIFEVGFPRNLKMGHLVGTFSFHLPSIWTAPFLFRSIPNTQSHQHPKGRTAGQSDDDVLLNELLHVPMKQRMALRTMKGKRGAGFNKKEHK